MFICTKFKKSTLNVGYTSERLNTSLSERLVVNYEYINLSDDFVKRIKGLKNLIGLQTKAELVQNINNQ